MPADPADAAERRALLVRRHLAPRGLDERVLAAMGEVPREAFVPASQADHAYDDRALPIGEGQTISQPFVVGLMLAALELGPGDRLLEVGAGSGYAAAVASRLCAHVIALERSHRLAAEAAERLERLGYANLTVLQADGTLGWPGGAPYDAILVSAAATAVPAALVDQLGTAGRMVVPVGPAAFHQQLVRLRRTPAGTVEESMGAVAFVPLVAGLC